MRIVVFMVALVAVIGRPSPRFTRMVHPNSIENSHEVWQMTLPETIRIGLADAETVRVISTGAQGIPLGGFEPTAPGPDGEPAPPGWVPRRFTTSRSRPVSPGRAGREPRASSIRPRARRLSGRSRAFRRVLIEGPARPRIASGRSDGSPSCFGRRITDAPSTSGWSTEIC